MHGWIGKLLRVNLSTSQVSTEPLDPGLAKDYLGARGLGTKYFCNEVDPRVDPLSPENKLIFAPGPLTGTYAPSGGRYNVVTKGPLNGTIAASNSGGTSGSGIEIRRLRHVDHRGQGGKTGLSLDKGQRGGNPRRRASVGKTVPDTQDAICGETDADAKVACIGPAGENQVLFAAIMNDMHRAAGRCGAVMGSKNLKAVAVRGYGSVTCADHEAFLAAVMDARQKIQAHPVGGTGFRLYGSEILMNIINQVGGSPTRNWQDAFFPSADKVSGEALAANQLQRPKGCFSCIISCGRVTKVTNPKYKGEGEGPEYETAWGFGGDCGVDIFDAGIKANYYCNEYGMDTISMGSTVACAMELFEKGFITLEDTGGIELNFGNADAMVEVVRLTGVGEGFGKKLGLGSYRLAESYGHPELSMTVKKQEMPAYDARAIQGVGLNYATSNRGGCHMRGYTIETEVLGNPVFGPKVDQHTIDGKPQIAINWQNLTAALDATGACQFTTFGIASAELAAMPGPLTGIEYTADDFLKCGDRIWNLERLFNLKAGFTAKDDTLPPRLLKEPIKTGPSKGKVNLLPEMLPEYYRLRGWDEYGVPTPEKLQELGLSA